MRAGIRRAQDYLRTLHDAGFALEPGAVVTDGFDRRRVAEREQPGALLGKIGDSGSVFVVGESYKTTCKKEGRLYLQIAPGPWGGNANMVGGSYKVNIMGGRDTAER